MSTALILVFILIILAYAIAIYTQHRKGQDEIKMHFSREDKEALAREIEAVDIPDISHWPQETPKNEEQSENSDPS